MKNRLYIVERYPNTGTAAFRYGRSKVLQQGLDASPFDVSPGWCLENSLKRFLMLWHDLQPGGVVS